MTAQIRYLGTIVYLRILKLLRTFKKSPGRYPTDCSQTDENPDGLELLESLDIKKHWKGVAENKGYRGDVHLLIKDKACFEEEWLKLGINLPMPKIDFSKRMVIEIVKKNASREIILKDIYYEGGQGEKIKKEILYNYYIDSTIESKSLAYLLLVTAKSDLPISFRERRYYDGFYIAKGYFYAPTECN